MSRPTIARSETGTAAPRPQGSSFYLAMRLLDRKRREAMFAIHGFCRAVDDIADGPQPDSERRAALDTWREWIGGLYQGRSHEATRYLVAPIQEFELSQADFLAIIDGMEMDIGPGILAPNLEILDLYCDRVASAVGRLSTPVFGMDLKGGIALAHVLGRALQLTNILRDIAEDAAIGRMYLPRELLEAAGLPLPTPTTLAGIAQDQRIALVSASLAAIAETHFNQAWQIMQPYPRRVIRAPRLMAGAYWRLLQRVRQAKSGLYTTPVRLGVAEKLWILVRFGLF